MDYIFNELSVSKVNTLADAHMVLETFVKSSIKANEFGLIRIRLGENCLDSLYQIIIYSDYRIDNWLKDPEVNSDIKLKFKELIANPPLIKHDELELKSLYEWSRFRIKIAEVEHSVFGLGAAHILGTLAISLFTQNEWKIPEVTITHDYIENDGSEKSAQAIVKNFSNDELLLFHKDWIETEKKNSLTHCLEFWGKRHEFFPHLLFGTDIEKQLHSIGLTKNFKKIIDVLYKLNVYCGNWKNEGFDLMALKEETKLDISGESECTKKKYPLLRNFKLHNGQKMQFDLHIKIPEFRIYFHPDSQTRIITIGYIGKHLRTCKYD